MNPPSMLRRRPDGEPVAGRTVAFRLEDGEPLEAVTGDDGERW